MRRLAGASGHRRKAQTGSPRLTLRLEADENGGMAEPNVDDPRVVGQVDGARIAELERSLAAIRALNDAVFVSSYDGIAVLDSEGVYLEVNTAYERMTGIPRERWIGRRVEEMQRLPDVPKQSATLQVLSTKRPATTLVNTRGGELVMITASPHFGSDGEMRNVIQNMRNITQLNILKFQLEKARGSAKLLDLRKARRHWLESQLAAAAIDELVVASPVMENLLSTAAEIADFDSTVLIDGETGTGKGMIARFLHRLSRRAGKPFVEVNCGALPENLVESELFGHEAGAFTGSLRTGKKGQFELANGGTIFLDESASCQSPRRPSYSRSSTAKRSAHLAGRRRGSSTYALFAPPTATSANSWRSGSSAKICSIGSRSFFSMCRRSANAQRKRRRSFTRCSSTSTRSSGATRCWRLKL